MDLALKPRTSVGRQVLGMTPCDACVRTLSSIRKTVQTLPQGGREKCIHAPFESCMSNTSFDTQEPVLLSSPLVLSTYWLYVIAPEDTKGCHSGGGATRIW